MNTSEPWQEWKEVCKKNGISYQTFHQRLNGKWEPKIAATRPPKKQGKKGPGSDLNIKLYTIFKNRNPIFTGLVEDCANHLRIKTSDIYDGLRINGFIVFEVE